MKVGKAWQTSRNCKHGFLLCEVLGSIRRQQAAMVPRAGQPRRQLEELAAHWPAFPPGISLASQFNSLPVSHWKASRKMSPVTKSLTTQCTLPGKLSIRKKKLPTLCLSISAQIVAPCGRQIPFQHRILLWSHAEPTGRDEHLSCVAGQLQPSHSSKQPPAHAGIVAPL